MKIGNALKDLKKPCISFEFFPPSDDSELPAFYDVAEKLAGASPLFASVTYGAGGSKQGRTLSVAKALAGMGLTVMSHLTCVGASPLRLMNYMYDPCGEIRRRTSRFRGTVLSATLPILCPIFIGSSLIFL